MKKRRWIIVAIVIAIFCWPTDYIIPVKGANSSSYHPESFWYYPWGKSVTHKGVDIFAKYGEDVLASTSGIVIYVGEVAMGGKIVLILGPRLRSHYYAHLSKIKVEKYQWVNQGEVIGNVGDSGNAKGKSPHLHYSIVNCFPRFWKIDQSPQGWKKMFYVNPIATFDE